MKNGPKSDNGVLNSLESAVNSENRAEETNRSFSTPGRLGLGGAALLAVLGVSGTSDAGQESADHRTETLNQLRQYAINHESSKVYRDAHPSDLLIGLGHDELVRAMEMMDAFPDMSVETLYLLVRGPGAQSPGTDHSNPSSIHYGTEPILIPHNTDAVQTLADFVDAHYDGEDVQTKQEILNAMVQEAQELGRIGMTAPGGYLALAHDVLLAGEESLMGMYAPSPAPAEAAPEKPESQPKVVIEYAPKEQKPEKKEEQAAPTEAAKTVKGVPEEEKVAAEPQPEPCSEVEVGKQQLNIYNSAVNQLEDPSVPEESVRSNAELNLEALAEKCPGADNAETLGDVNEAIENYACQDPRLQDAIDAAQQEAKIMMGENASEEDIKAAAEERWSAIQERCTLSPDYFDGARAALNNILADYVLEEVNRLKFSGLDMQGGFMKGEDHVSPSSAGGHLSLAWKNKAEAGKAGHKPMGLSLFLEGGNYLVNDIDGGDIEKPSGGMIFNVGTGQHPGHSGDWGLRLSLNGLWFRQTSAYDLGTSVQGPTTIPIEGGTETTTIEQSESGMSETEGDPLGNWQATAESYFEIGQLEINLGVGFGQYMRSEASSSHIETSTDVAQDSHADGPPAVDVHTEGGSDVTTDTVTLTDVLTNMLLFRAGGLYRLQDPNLAFGLDAFGSYMWGDSDSETTIDNHVVVHDTVTDINIEGFPSEQEIVPGSTSDDQEVEESSSSHSQWNLVLRARVLYDAKNMALRLEAGPVFGDYGDGVEMNGMPVGGNVTGLGTTNGLIFGGNAGFDGDDFNLDGMFATYDDFQKFVGYVDMVNELRSASMIDDQLRNQYLDMLLHSLVETNDGFMVNLGMRVDAEGDVSGHATAAYTHQFPGAGPLGLSVQADSEDMGIGATAYIPLTHGMNLRFTGYTNDDELADERVWGLNGALVYHWDLPVQGPAPAEEPAPIYQSPQPKPEPSPAEEEPDAIEPSPAE